MNSSKQWKAARIGNCSLKLTVFNNSEIIHNIDRKKQNQTECKCSDNIKNVTLYLKVIYMKDCSKQHLSIYLKE